jgi:LCP family protein required for cell wall assembly
VEAGQPIAPVGATARRRWPRRLFIVTCVVVLLGTTTFAFADLYLRHKISEIKRVDVPSASEGGPLEEDTGTVMNVLVVGSDSRANVTGEEAAATGKGRSDTIGQRSDTIMVLHIDSTQKQVSLLSIPRDLDVTVAETGQFGRINSAFNDASPDEGPTRLIATVKNELGISINHYVEVDFVGFKNIVDTLGGVTMYVPTPVRDVYSNLDIPKGGCVEFDGDTGLAWVRSRYFEYYDGGRWQYDPRADIGRIERQHDFIRRVLGKLSSSNLANPLRLNAHINDGVKNLTVDKTLSVSDMVKIARKFQSLDADGVAMETLKTEPNYAGGTYLGEKLVQPDAQQQIDRFNGIAPAAPPPASAGDAASDAGAVAAASSTPVTVLPATTTTTVPAC